MRARNACRMTGVAAALSGAVLGILFAAGAAAPKAAVAELKVTIREWDVPTPNSRPHDPALAPDGSLW